MRSWLLLMPSPSHPRGFWSSSLDLNQYLSVISRLRYPFVLSPQIKSRTGIKFYLNSVRRSKYFSEFGSIMAGTQSPKYWTAYIIGGIVYFYFLPIGLAPWAWTRNLPIISQMLLPIELAQDLYQLKLVLQFGVLGSNTALQPCIELYALHRTLHRLLCHRCARCLGATVDV